MINQSNFLDTKLKGKQDFVFTHALASSFTEQQSFYFALTGIPQPSVKLSWLRPSTFNALCLPLPCVSLSNSTCIQDLITSWPVTYTLKYAQVLFYKKYDLLCAQYAYLKYGVDSMQSHVSLCSFKAKTTYSVCGTTNSQKINLHSVYSAELVYSNSTFNLLKLFANNSLASTDLDFTSLSKKFFSYNLTIKNEENSLDNQKLTQKQKHLSFMPRVLSLTKLAFLINKVIFAPVKVSNSDLTICAYQDNYRSAPNYQGTYITHVHQDGSFDSPRGYNPSRSYLKRKKPLSLKERQQQAKIKKNLVINQSAQSLKRQDVQEQGLIPSLRTLTAQHNFIAQDKREEVYSETEQALVSQTDLYHSSNITNELFSSLAHSIDSDLETNPKHDILAPKEPNSTLSSSSLYLSKEPPATMITKARESLPASYGKSSHYDIQNQDLTEEQSHSLAIPAHYVHAHDPHLKGQALQHLNETNAYALGAQERNKSSAELDYNSQITTIIQHNKNSSYTQVKESTTEDNFTASTAQSSLPYSSNEQQQSASTTIITKQEVIKTSSLNSFALGVNNNSEFKDFIPHSAPTNQDAILASNKSLYSQKLPKESPHQKDLAPLDTLDNPHLIHSQDTSSNSINRVSSTNLTKGTPLSETRTEKKATSRLAHLDALNPQNYAYLYQRQAFKQQAQETDIAKEQEVIKTYTHSTDSSLKLSVDFTENTATATLGRENATVHTDSTLSNLNLSAKTSAFNNDHYLHDNENAQSPATNTAFADNILTENDTHTIITVGPQGRAHFKSEEDPNFTRVNASIHTTFTYHNDNEEARHSVAKTLAFDNHGFVQQERTKALEEFAYKQASDSADELNVPFAILKQGIELNEGKNASLIPHYSLVSGQQQVQHSTEQLVSTKYAQVENSTQPQNSSAIMSEEEEYALNQASTQQFAQSDDIRQEQYNSSQNNEKHIATLPKASFIEYTSSINNVNSINDPHNTNTQRSSLNSQSLTAQDSFTAYIQEDLSNYQELSSNNVTSQINSFVQEPNHHLVSKEQASSTNAKQNNINGSIYEHFVPTKINSTEHVELTGQDSRINYIQYQNPALLGAKNFKDFSTPTTAQDLSQNLTQNSSHSNYTHTETTKTNEDNRLQTPSVSDTNSSFEQSNQASFFQDAFSTESADLALTDTTSTEDILAPADSFVDQDDNDHIDVLDELPELIAPAMPMFHQEETEGNTFVVHKNSTASTNITSGNYDDSLGFDTKPAVTSVQDYDFSDFTTADGSQVSDEDLKVKVVSITQQDNLEQIQSSSQIQDEEQAEHSDHADHSEEESWEDQQKQYATSNKMTELEEKASLQTTFDTKSVLNENEPNKPSALAHLILTDIAQDTSLNNEYEEYVNKQESSENSCENSSTLQDQPQQDIVNIVHTDDVLEAYLETNSIPFDDDNVLDRNLDVTSNSLEVSKDLELTESNTTLDNLDKTELAQSVANNSIPDQEATETLDIATQHEELSSIEENKEQTTLNNTNNEDLTNIPHALASAQAKITPDKRFVKELEDAEFLGGIVHSSFMPSELFSSHQEALYIESINLYKDDFAKLGHAEDILNKTHFNEENHRPLIQASISMQEHDSLHEEPVSSSAPNSVTSADHSHIVQLSSILETSVSLNNNITSKTDLTKKEQNSALDNSAKTNIKQNDQEQNNTEQTSAIELDENLSSKSQLDNIIQDDSLQNRRVAQTEDINLSQIDLAQTSVYHDQELDENQDQGQDAKQPNLTIENTVADNKEQVETSSEEVALNESTSLLTQNSFSEEQDLSTQEEVASSVSSLAKINAHDETQSDIEQEHASIKAQEFEKTHELANKHVQKQTQATHSFNGLETSLAKSENIDLDFNVSLQQAKVSVLNTELLQQTITESNLNKISEAEESTDTNKNNLKDSSKESALDNIAKNLEDLSATNEFAQSNKQEQPKETFDKSITLTDSSTKSVDILEQSVEHLQEQATAKVNQSEQQAETNLNDLSINSEQLPTTAQQESLKDSLQDAIDQAVSISSIEDEEQLYAKLNMPISDLTINATDEENPLRYSELMAKEQEKVTKKLQAKTKQEETSSRNEKNSPSYLNKQNKEKNLKNKTKNKAKQKQAKLNKQNLAQNADSIDSLHKSLTTNVIDSSAHTKITSTTLPNDEQTKENLETISSKASTVSTFVSSSSDVLEQKNSTIDADKLALVPTTIEVSESKQTIVFRAPEEKTENKISDDNNLLQDASENTLIFKGNGKANTIEEHDGISTIISREEQDNSLLKQEADKKKTEAEHKQNNKEITLSFTNPTKSKQTLVASKNTTKTKSNFDQTAVVVYAEYNHQSFAELTSILKHEAKPSTDAKSNESKQPQDLAKLTSYLKQQDATKSKESFFDKDSHHVDAFSNLSLSFIKDYRSPAYREIPAESLKLNTKKKLTQDQNAVAKQQEKSAQNNQERSSLNLELSAQATIETKANDQDSQNLLEKSNNKESLVKHSDKSTLNLSHESQEKTEQAITTENKLDENKAYQPKLDSSGTLTEKESSSSTQNTSSFEEIELTSAELSLTLNIHPVTHTSTKDDSAENNKLQQRTNTSLETTTKAQDSNNNNQADWFKTENSIKAQSGGILVPHTNTNTTNLSMPKIVVEADDFVEQIKQRSQETTSASIKQKEQSTDDVSNFKKNNLANDSRKQEAQRKKERRKAKKRNARLKDNKLLEQDKAKLQISEEASSDNLITITQSKVNAHEVVDTSKMIDRASAQASSITNTNVHAAVADVLKSSKTVALDLSEKEESLSLNDNTLELAQAKTTLVFRQNAASKHEHSSANQNLAKLAEELMDDFNDDFSDEFDEELNQVTDLGKTSGMIFVHKNK